MLRRVQSHAQSHTGAQSHSTVLEYWASDSILFLFQHTLNDADGKAQNITSHYHDSEASNSLSMVGGPFSAGRLHLDLKTGL